MTCFNCRRPTKSSGICPNCRKLTAKSQKQQLHESEERTVRSHLAYNGTWDNIVKAYEEDR